MTFNRDELSERGKEGFEFIYKKKGEKKKLAQESSKI